MNDELVLLGVGSDGSVEQWDGNPAPTGILLRWFHRTSLGFPDYGYDLYRARVPDIPALAWDILAAWLEGQTSYDHAGDVILGSEVGFQFQGTATGLALVIAPGDRITLTFPDPAWYISVEPAQFGTSFEVEIFAGGESKDVRQLASGGRREEWVTRGVERIELTGDGAVTWIRYALLNAPRNWAHLTHLCLPVTDPAYPCGPQPTGSDEDEARGRVPAGVDWAARYSDGFADLHPYLRALATRTPTSFPPSGDPDAPDLGMDPASAVHLAALDPHLARAIGLAWDDDLSPYGLDGKDWSYKLVGKWKGTRVLRQLASGKALAMLSDHGVRLRGDWQNLELVDGAIRVHVREEPALRVEFAEPVDEVLLEVSTAPAIDWLAFDAAGGRIASGTLGARRDERGVRGLESGGVQVIKAAGASAIELTAAEAFLIFALGFTGVPVERFTILPFVVAADPGPPNGPASITAHPEQPGGTASPLQAALTWDLDATPAGVYAEHACVLYQIAAHQLSTDPTPPQPQAPPLRREYWLSNGRPILVPSEVAGAPKPPARYYTDQNLSEGWRAWWARGIDLFGRVSAASPPTVERLEDSALPPPPFLLHSEYVQSALNADQAALSGRSSTGRAWASANVGANGVAVSWGWTPELEALAPDVDGFRVYARRPIPVQNPAPNSPQKTYDGIAWGTALDDIGPIPVRLDGIATAVGTNIPNVTVTAVNPIGSADPPEQWYCDTNLSLDAGTGTLVGALLQAGTQSWQITGNGDGTNAWVAVKATSSTTAAPAPGGYEIHAGTSAIARVETDPPPPALGTDPFQRRIAGALVTQKHRLLVLGRSAGTFICRRPEGDPALPSANDTIRWYPAYVFVLQDTGYGPVASTTEPVAHAQITVTSVRDFAGKRLESSTATPGILTAVDTTPPPPPPPLPLIPTGDYCAEVATRADWYGISRFSLMWTATAGMGYVVYRALGDAIMQLDLAAHRQGTTVTAHSFPQSVWPPVIWNDANRRQLAQQDIAALDAAISGGNAVAIQAAYDALHADAQQMIAGQAAVEGAYVAMNGVPLPATQSAQMSYLDEFDGRTRSHWFYRVAARSPAGLESAKTPPTPPICAPDVVPPAVPLAQLALADTGTVKLRWQRSPDPDVARYLIFRSDEETDTADVRTMQLVARVAPTPTSSLGPNEVAPLTVTGEPLWLEHRDLAAAGRDWFYRIVAEDLAGNRSQPSEILRGRSLLAPPEPPAWNPPSRDRDVVKLSWTHPTDQRLACLVERRTLGGALWRAVSPWLPRGVYAFEDRPLDVSVGWEYRLRVRDHLDQVSLTVPTVTLAALP